MEKAQLWTELDPNPKTRQKLLDLIQSDPQAVHKAFNGPRIEFGTAGLRSKMDFGPKNMNDLVILQTCQGLVDYLFEIFDEKEVKSRGIVIGFDHRENRDLDLSSRKFAILSSRIILHFGIKIYFFNAFVATPLIPFSLNHFNCIAGVMITASHNPKQDNGFKLYFQNGCQIIPPHDSKIAEKILLNLLPCEKFADISMQYLQNQPNFEIIGEDIENLYFDRVSSKLNYTRERNEKSKFKVMYSAMHGVGSRFISKIWSHFGFPKDNLFFVQEQRDPHPDFPTVSFPNPEEKNALDIAIICAEEKGCDLVIANDPDADRLAVAQRNKNTNSWKLFSGNELGSIFAKWQVMNCPKENSAMVVSLVSSKQVKRICSKECISYFETLTGFKYLGNKCHELQKKGIKILLAFEEAIGFCLGDVVLDKDGISAAAVLCEIVESIPDNDLIAFHESINKEYGYFISNNGYVIINDVEIKHHKMKDLENLAVGFKIKPDFKITSNKAENGVIKMKVNGNIHLCFRTSGTEPKLKFYAEIDGTDPIALRTEIDDLVDQTKKILLE